MADELDYLLSVIQQALPQSRLEPASEEQIAAIKAQHPAAPEHYLSFLRRVGSGSVGYGFFAIYKAPCPAEEIFDDPDMAERLPGILFFGDDFRGFMAGFDTRHNWRIVAVESDNPRPIPLPVITTGEFIADRLADA